MPMRHMSFCDAAVNDVWQWFYVNGAVGLTLLAAWAFVLYVVLWHRK